MSSPTYSGDPRLLIRAGDDGTSKLITHLNEARTYTERMFHTLMLDRLTPRVLDRDHGVVGKGASSRRYGRCPVDTSRASIIDRPTQKVPVVCRQGMV